ncbi:MAG: hypothetical protein ACI4DW_05935 [Lachnospiraceae bacterium]
MRSRLSALFLLVVLLTGCGLVGEVPGEDAEESEEVEYVYDDADVIDSVSIEKSVYDENRLKIYMSGAFTPDYIMCYDEDFDLIDCEWEYNYLNGKMVIKGEEAEKISGIFFADSYMQYYIRYLDSDQYAIFSLCFADDAGWLECEGDATLYYTQEELDAQRESAEEAQRKIEETFAEFEGMWVSDEDPGAYVRFYYEDDLRCMEIRRLADDGEYDSEYHSVDDIFVSEGYDGEVLTILDAPSWGLRIEYNLAADHNSFSGGYGGSSTYVRQ